jgi:beta-lactam-binding protein with PASTA domain
MRARWLTGITLVMLMLGGTSMSAATAGPAHVQAESAKIIVPNVVGMRMDRATRTLRNRGLRVNEECSGLFGCIIKSRWWVCEQDPAAGRKLNRYQVVVIYAERRGEC